MRGTSLETALEKVGRVITDRYGLRLVCKGEQCRTDGHTIFLPSMPDDVDPGLLGAIRGWADHEVSHILHTETALARPFKAQHGREAFTILNVLEDARVEALMAERYPGSRINLASGYRWVQERAASGRTRRVGPFGLRSWLVGPGQRAGLSVTWGRSELAPLLSSGG